MKEETNIKDLFSAIWRKKVFIVVSTIIFLLIGLILYGNKSKISNDNANSSEGTGKSELSFVETDFILNRGVSYLEDGSEGSYKLNIDAGVITNLNEFSVADSFLKSILSELNSTYKVEDLESNINIFGDGKSDILTLIVGYENENDALIISNKIIDNIKEKIDILYNVKDITIINGPEVLSNEKIEKLEKKLKSSTLIYDTNKNKTESITVENSGSKKKIILVTLVGFILACGYIIVAEIFDTSIKSESNLENITNLKNLVKIPNSKYYSDDRFNILRTNLNKYKTILITSPEEKDGKSYVSENLANSFAKSGKKVLLTNVNAILNDSFLEDKKENSKNLTIIIENEKVEENSSFKVEERLNKLKEIYEIIIIDSENVLESANTLVVSKEVQAVVLVSFERKTKIENIIRAKNNIEDFGGKLVGNILNNTSKK